MRPPVVAEADPESLLLEQVLKTAPDAMLVADGAGTIVMVNDQARRMFGYDGDSLVGKAVEVLVPPSLRAGHVAYRRSYMADPKARPMGEGRELMGIRSDGSEFPVEISLSPITVGSDELVLAAVRDVSARRRAEDMFRGLLESAPDGMVIVNQAGTIVLVNAQAEQIFGYARDEMLGEKVELLIPDRFGERHVHHRTSYFDDPKVRPMGAGLDLWARHRDGHEFPVAISLSPLETEDGTLVTAAVRDITREREVQASMERSLTEKEILLKEVHHRVKNNLQIVSSLLNLQRGTTADPQVANVLEDSRYRIRSLALVHERLYRSGNVEALDLGDYVQELVAELRRSFSGVAAVQTSVDVPSVSVDLDSAVTLGLIVNELVSNAFKHAFPTREGSLSVSGRLEGDRLHLTIADDGPGLPADFDVASADTLGMQLVDTLTKQLDGTWSVDGPGTRWELEVGL